MENFAAYIDQTLLKPQTTISEIQKFSEEAISLQVAGICINSVFVPDVFKLREQYRATAAVVAVVGFPLGASLSAAKAYEAAAAIAAGADEIDMVIHVGALLAQDYKLVEADIASVVATKPKGGVKVILETGFLDAEQIRLATKCAVHAGAAFVKTSTGFGPRGASLEDIELMRNEIESLGATVNVKIKASGGIRTAVDFKQYIQAGATRIGTSNGQAILQELLGKAGSHLQANDY